MHPGKAYVAYIEFNVGRCTNQLLRSCFKEDSDTLYGTLSHSHLRLVRLSMQTGATWGWPAGWQDVFQGKGLVSMAAVAAKDENLASLLTEGLLMEVLSWKIYKDEPTACSLISHALNSGHNVALHTT